MLHATREADQRIRQGDILRDIEFIEDVEEVDGEMKVSLLTFPYSVVLTQDCDLEQDHKTRTGDRALAGEDKLLFTVLLAPIYNIEHVLAGHHLRKLERKCQTISRNRTPGQNLVQNLNPRYHTIDLGPEGGIPTSVADFKHFYTVSIERLLRLKESAFICSLEPLYREDLSQRFSSFLARIGLPEVRVPAAGAAVTR